MSKKIAILAMAGVVAVLALPPTASATWKHHGVAIQEDQGGTVTGNARFQGELGGVECQASAAAVFFANQTDGELETYGPHPTNDTTNCKGLGALATCQVHNWTATGLPWSLSTGPGNTIVIGTGQTHAQFTGGFFCLIKHSVTSPGSVTITPNQPNTITSGQLSGTLTQQVQTNNGTKHIHTITVSGTGNIVAPNAHTYDI